MCRRKEKKNKSKCKFNDYFIKLSKTCSLFYIFFISLIIIAAAVGLAELYIKNGYVIKFGWWIIIALVLIFIGVFTISKFLIGIGSIWSCSPNKVDGVLIVLFLSFFPLALLFSPKNLRYYNLSNCYTIVFFVLAGIGLLGFLIKLFIYLIRKDKGDNCYKLDCFKNVNLMPDNIEDFYITDGLVDNDLLNRKLLINQARDYIFKFKSKRNRVVAITGKWGSGKSVLFKLAYNSLTKEEKKNIILISDFDCWNYEDERSLFIGIIQTIYKKLHLGTLSRSTIDSIEGLANTVLKDAPEKSNLIKFLFPPKYTDQIKNLINGKLEKTGKRLVFVFENLDRASQDNIVYVYKAISSSLKFVNTTYVCLYHEDIVKEALSSHGYKYNYLDKVLDLKLTIHCQKDDDLFEFSNLCLSKYFKKYFQNKYDYYKNEEQVKGSLKYIDNPRDLCRFLNNYNLKFQNADYLNTSDLVTITVLKTIDFDFYNFLFENKNILTTSNLLDGTNIFSQKASDFIQNYFIEDAEGIKGKYAKYKEILLYLFPNLAKYFSNIVQYKIKEISMKPICYKKFFDAYFIDIEKEIKPVEKEGNKKLSAYDKTFSSDDYYKNSIQSLDEKTIVKFLNNDPRCAYGDYIFSYGNYIVQNEKFFEFFKYITEFWSDPDYKRKGSLAIYFNYLTKFISEDDYNKLLIEGTADYKMLLFYKECVNNNGGFETDIADKLFSHIINLIYKNNVNILDSRNYFDGFVLMMYRFNKEEFKRYLTMNANSFKETQLFRLLKEIASLNDSMAIRDIINDVFDKKIYTPIITKLKPHNGSEKILLNYFTQRFLK